jgi:hypothetical protein
VFEVFIFQKVPLSWLTVDEGMKTFRNFPLKEEEALLWRYQPHRENLTQGEEDSVLLTSSFTLFFGQT